MNKRLERIKRLRFPLEGREKRIERALAALREPGTIELTAEEWREVAEEATEEQNLPLSLLDIAE